MEETTQIKKTRPVFLTVLCILTFLGSGWGIIDSFTDYFASDIAEGAVEMVEETMDDAMDEIDESEDLSETQRNFIEGMFGSLTESMTAENIRKSALVSLISNILTLVGALLMWNLNKKGYYLYILGILLLVIGLAAIFKGIIGVAAAGATGFIGVIFIVLYGVNVKHMT